MFITGNADEETIDWMGQPCWFCNRHPPAKGKSSPVSLKKFAPGAGDSIKVLTCSVSVPRCDDCAAAHAKLNSKAANIMMAGAALSFVVFVLWDPFDLPWWGSALLVFAGALPGAAILGSASGLPAGVKPESEAEGFVSVRQLIKDGWQKNT